MNLARLFAAITISAAATGAHGGDCYHKIGGVCKGGYASGYLSDCVTPCSTAVVPHAAAAKKAEVRETKAREIKGKEIKAKEIKADKRLPKAAVADAKADSKSTKKEDRPADEKKPARNVPQVAR